MTLTPPLPLINYFGYLFDGANWHLGGDASIPRHLGEHLLYTVLALAISAAIALPVGLLIGHTDRGAFLAIGAGNLGRSLPTFGLVLLLVTWRGVGLVPLLIALVVLAIPPILAQTYAGLRAVDGSAVDAAVGMGMRPSQVLFGVEVPMAMPLILGGLRSALLQVVATATVAAFGGLDGLGVLLRDGISQNDYPQVFAGAVLVALLAIALDYVGAAVERAVVSPGVRERRGRRTRASAPTQSPAREAPAVSTSR